jgi:hypothetical protein
MLAINTILVGSMDWLVCPMLRFTRLHFKYVVPIRMPSCEGTPQRMAEVEQGEEGAPA